MAFLAVNRVTGALGIFTGPDPVTDKVISVGDPLLGSKVKGLDFSRGLNDGGQLTFLAFTDDGASGIFRADPAAANKSGD